MKCGGRVGSGARKALAGRSAYAEIQSSGAERRPDRLGGEAPFEARVVEGVARVARLPRRELARRSLAVRELHLQFEVAIGLRITEALHEPRAVDGAESLLAAETVVSPHEIARVGGHLLDGTAGDLQQLRAGEVADVLEGARDEVTVRELVDADGIPVRERRVVRLELRVTVADQRDELHGGDDALLLGELGQRRDEVGMAAHESQFARLREGIGMDGPDVLQQLRHVGAPVGERRRAGRHRYRQKGRAGRDAHSEQPHRRTSFLPGHRVHHSPTLRRGIVRNKHSTPGGAQLRQRTTLAVTMRRRAVRRRYSPGVTP
jgi:hypothetical protein